MEQRNVEESGGHRASWAREGEREKEKRWSEFVEDVASRCLDKGLMGQARRTTTVDGDAGEISVCG